MAHYDPTPTTTERETMAAKPRLTDYENIPLRNLPEEMLLSKNKMAVVLKMNHRTVAKLMLMDGFPPPVMVGKFPAYRAGAVSLFMDKIGGPTV